jgi:CubicO group peptidase (beta-lactamase class C family)
MRLRPIASCCFGIRLIHKTHERPFCFKKSTAGRFFLRMAVAIVAEGQPVWQRGFGYADLETMHPVTPHTPFPIASVSKTFIGTALMQLEEDGVIDIDDNINDFGLPLPVGHPGLNDAGFPLRQLTNHTSGILDNEDI